MKSRARPSLTEIDRIDEIPTFASEEEEARFWSTHSLGQELLDAAEPPPPDEMPPTRGRSRPIAVRFNGDTLRRLRTLARKKGTGYQTLLKEFVLERLYEEEKREGLVG
jgi:hypothetical protein